MKTFSVRLDLDLAKRCTMPVFWMKISIMNLWVIWKDILHWVQESLKRHASLNIWSYHTEQNCICASGNVVLFTSSKHIFTEWLTRWKKWTQYFKILGHLTSLLLPMNVFWEEFLFCWNTQCIEICTWPNFASKYIFAFLNTHLFYCQPFRTFGV